MISYMIAMMEQDGKAFGPGYRASGGRKASAERSVGPLARLWVQIW